MMMNDLMLLKEGGKKKLQAAALQALSSEAAVMRGSCKLSLRSREWNQHLMICCDIVSAGLSRLRAVDRNRRNRNILKLSHIVTTADVS